MKTNFKNLILYVGAMVVATLLLVSILNFGSTSNTSFSNDPSLTGWLNLLQQDLFKNLQVPLTGLLVQLLVILVFSKLCSIVLKYVGQPQVVGEMIAGILLGKSFFALLWPAGFSTIFPDSGMPRLYFLSQVGLIFFMFVVGLELKILNLKKRASAAIFISHVSIVFPFLLGSLLSLGLYQTFSNPNVEFSSFALFMGIAMSITAFPVLARILQEKKLTDTNLGTMAITCAAVDDVTAWCVLAAVLGVVKAGTIMGAFGMLALSLIYILFMLKIIKPILWKKLGSTIDGNLSKEQLSLIFCVVLGSALVSEIIGIHALFGAFLAGTIMPQNVLFRTNLIGKIEDFSTVILLPIFFAYTGIRTEVGLLNSWTMLVVMAIVTTAMTGPLLLICLPELRKLKT